MPHSADRDALLTTLVPICSAINGLDLADNDVETTLTRLFPPTGHTISHIGQQLNAAFAAGWLCPKENMGVKFGRVAKATPHTFNLSIDAVEMNGAGAPHTHPNGEVSLCFPLEGTPTFESHTDGWVVMAPGSRHVPAVTGGRMLIIYFLPGGEMKWG